MTTSSRYPGFLSTALFSLAAIWSSPAAAGGTSTAANTASAGVVFASGFEAFAPPSREEAARFLNQATFGATLADIDRLMQIGYDAWFREQFELPIGWRHEEKLDNPSNPTHCGVRKPYTQEVVSSFWGSTYRTQDQLRQRMAYTLSQIFVISFSNNTLEYWSHMPPSYLDMLGRNAFGNYRQLIEDVTLHPAMGVYLSHFYNAKEDPATGRIPDQNYARELLQLFSIGLHELNIDGSPRLQGSGPTAGQPIPTYSQDDIVGISRVMTGWAPSNQAPNWSNYQDPLCDKQAQRSPMRAFPAYHSTSEKRFLGITIPAQSTPDPVGGLRILLDRVHGHANVGPFIGRQLIQRMVTSNPSPAYVRRVAQAFNNNGQGVRGDMKAVIKAVLMDPEARDPNRVTDPGWGKIREPILRMAQLLRAFDATTINSNGLTDVFAIGGFALDFSITQQVLHSPTVFNFYRPDYAPAGSELEASGLVAPEMQIIDENNAAMWTGAWSQGILMEGGRVNCCTSEQWDFYYWRLRYQPYIALLQQSPEALVDRLNLLLMAGQMSPQLRQVLLSSAQMQTDGVSWVTQRPRGVNHIRVGYTTFLLINSTEYVVQK